MVVVVVMGITAVNSPWVWESTRGLRNDPKGTNISRLPLLVDP